MNIYIQKQSQGTRITYLQLEETLAREGGGEMNLCCHHVTTIIIAHNLKPRSKEGSHVTLVSCS